MQVRDVMTAGCVTVPSSATLADCVTRMLMAGTGSVIVDDDGPLGIVTESDVLSAAQDIDEPLSAIPAHVAMSHPVERIEPTATVRKAAERMQTLDIKKLLVARGFDPVGVVTVTDLVWHFSDFQREAGRLALKGNAWEHGE
ncbi:CBS domain-containing protein [Salinigranum halophilum]|jgi:CBS domain-containing protein|uniref:CBS domain-containing protein n=1 Tax=Salinigranum halophilum TaxID=2565931 RepID=UPI001F2C0C53|nr:CBS domain-containing protein [Salinigranum halophilum]